MARDLSGIRERRRNKARTMDDENGSSYEQNSPKQVSKNPKQVSEPEVPIVKINLFARFKAKFFRKKTKEEKLLQQISKSHFKPLIFSLYILIFIGLIFGFSFYIIKQESKYITKSKKLITTTPTPAPEKEKKTVSPLIADQTKEDSFYNSDSKGFAAVIDDQTYTLESVIPTNLKVERFELGVFLNFIKSNRDRFCKYAEQSRMAYIFANGELRDYSATSYPLTNNKLDYNNCLSNTVWTESELFSLYQNLYDDFISPKTEDDALLKKLVAANQYKMNINFNAVRDFPQSFDGALLSEEKFNQLLSGNYMNQLLLCDYSNKFAKVYDVFVSKRNGSLRPINNCYTDSMNLQEAYVQYKFYYSYIQPSSKDVNAESLHSALIPNYSN